MIAPIETLRLQVSDNILREASLLHNNDKDYSNYCAKIAVGSYLNSIGNYEVISRVSPWKACVLTGNQDKEKIYIFCLTIGLPVIVVQGWIKGSEGMIEANEVTAPYSSVKYYRVPLEQLNHIDKLKGVL